MSDGGEAVDRMYQALVAEIGARRPELLEENFTVAEIYQNLVPYRTHRDVIGTEMSGDYEHVLMRLLVGEGDYLTLESDTARRRLLAELDSIHPDTGLYRDFAACEVRLNEAQLPELESVGAGPPGNGAAAGSAGSDGSAIREIGDEPSPDLDEATLALDEPVPAGEPASLGAPDDSDAPVSSTVPQGPVLFEASAPGDAAVGAGSGDDPGADPLDVQACHWCREALPVRDDLQYCPHCGSPVDLRPCGTCGAEVEAGWSYCIACGSEVEA